jgi:glycerol kinase
MEKDTGHSLSLLRADGGASGNDYLMQYQSDILNTAVERPENRDTTALGVAYLAGIELGLWKDADELRNSIQKVHRFEPKMDENIRQKELSYWNKAVARSKDWSSGQKV